MRAYTPVVKAKASDLTALSLLSQRAKNNIKPLIEVAVSVDSGSVRTDIASATALLKSRPLDIPYYFDPLGIESHGRQIAAFESLTESGCSFTPVIGLGRGAIDTETLRKLLSTHRLGVGIRLELQDLEDAADDTWEQIIQLSSDLEVATSDIELLIDYKQIDHHSIDTLKETTLDFLALQPSTFQCGGITLIGSSALSSVAAIEPDGMARIKRRELLLWTTVDYELDGVRDIGFGDHGIICPDFVFSGPNPNANAKIRYTHGAQTIYFRGHGLFLPSRFEQYHDLAQRVVDSEFYLGRDFSFGDETIQLCASKQAGTGNLATWVKADTNHHIELVAQQTADIGAHIRHLSSESQIREMIEAL